MSWMLMLRNRPTTRTKWQWTWHEHWTWIQPILPSSTIDSWIQFLISNCTHCKLLTCNTCWNLLIMSHEPWVWYNKIFIFRYLYYIYFTHIHNTYHTVYITYSMYCVRYSYWNLLGRTGRTWTRRSRFRSSISHCEEPLFASKVCQAYQRDRRSCWRRMVFWCPRTIRGSWCLCSMVGGTRIPVGICDVQAQDSWVWQRWPCRRSGKFGQGSLLWLELNTKDSSWNIHKQLWGTPLRTTSSISL